MNEEDIPIDIHYNKLLDWLLNRRHCDNGWQASALVIRQKINEAIQDMPEHDDITNLLGGTYINYFHCVKIVEILKETEAASKNIFGRYSSQRMKDWQEVLNLYQKNSVYLAEGAQLLLRNVNYDIPSMKKQIQKLQQMQKDCSKKEGECASTASELKEKYHKECKKMGVEGKKIKTELMSLVKNLPSTYDSIADSTKELRDATDFYSQFVEFTLGQKEFGDNCVQLVKFVINKGNTTTYEWKTGKVPIRIEKSGINYSIEEEAMSTEETTDGIDFDVESSGIEFGDEPIEMPADIDYGDIDYGDIELCGDPYIEIEVLDQSAKEITTKAAELDEDVATGTDALSILDNTEMRVIFVNELIELQSFLSQRIRELKTDSDNVLTGSVFLNAPSSLQLDNLQVESMLNKVENVVNQLTSSKMQDLMLIRSSPRYVDRLAEKLKKISEDSERMMSVSRLMVTRRNESIEDQMNTRPKLDLIRKKMKELQRQMEQEISKKYKNRRVNIMGDINTI